MAGTIEGGRKAAETNRKKYGEDFYKVQGSKGGSVKGIKKGFACDSRTWFDKVIGKPSRAEIAGQKGGRISRRRPVTN